MAVWSVVLAVLAAAFILIHVLVLPGVFLRAERGRLPVTGRGVKSVESESGLSIVYEPDPETAKYIKQYSLSERGGKKFLLCKVDGNAVKIFNVKEIIKRQGFTEVCELPEETAYATLTVIEADGRKKGAGLRGEPGAKNLAWYLSLSAVADIICAVFAKICITNIFGGIYSESFLLSGMDWLYTMLAALGVAAVNVLAAAVCIMWKSGKLKGGKRNGRL